MPAAVALSSRVPLPQDEPQTACLECTTATRGIVSSALHSNGIASRGRSRALSSHSLSRLGHVSSSCCLFRRRAA